MINKLSEAIKLWFYGRLLKSTEVHEWFAHVRAASDLAHQKAQGAYERAARATAQVSTALDAAQEANARSAELGKMIATLSGISTNLTDAARYVAARMDDYQEGLAELTQRMDELEAWERHEPTIDLDVETLDLMLGEVETTDAEKD